MEQIDFNFGPTRFETDGARQVDGFRAPPSLELYRQSRK
jgi:hypothetical protein